jgi:hypothetical protein
MDIREHFELFRYLMQTYCMTEENILFVENVAGWCRENGIPERDWHKPLKLVAGNEAGCRLIIAETVSDKTIEDRITAMGIRTQITNVALDRAGMLDTPKKKLAYLFLSEYAPTLSEINDELQADEWAFAEMEKLGFFKE